MHNFDPQTQGTNAEMRPRANHCLWHSSAQASIKFKSGSKNFQS